MLHPSAPSLSPRSTHMAQHFLHLLDDVFKSHGLFVDEIATLRARIKELETDLKYAAENGWPPAKIPDIAGCAVYPETYMVSASRLKVKLSTKWPLDPIGAITRAHDRFSHFHVFRVIVQNRTRKTPDVRLFRGIAPRYFRLMRKTCNFYVGVGLLEWHFRVVLGPRDQLSNQFLP